MEKSEVCHIDSKQDFKSKTKEKIEHTSHDAENEQITDKPCSEEISEVIYDSQSELVSASFANDAKFWALVYSQEWKTAIRIGKGHLHRRLLYVLHDLTTNNETMELCTSQIYCKMKFCKKIGEKWIPNHRVLILPKDDKSLCKLTTLTPREPVTYITRKFLLKQGERRVDSDRQQNTTNLVSKFGAEEEVSRCHDFMGFNAFADEQLYKCVLSCLGQFTVLIETISDSNTYNSDTYVTFQRPKRTLVNFEKHVGSKSNYNFMHRRRCGLATSMNWAVRGRISKQCKWTVKK